MTNTLSDRTLVTHIEINLTELWLNLQNLQLLQINQWIYRNKFYLEFEVLNLYEMKPKKFL